MLLLLLLKAVIIFVTNFKFDPNNAKSFILYFHFDNTNNNLVFPRRILRFAHLSKPRRMTNSFISKKKKKCKKETNQLALITRQNKRIIDNIYRRYN